jgi:hypothetical protein
MLHIVAYLLKERAVKPEKQPLLGKGNITSKNGVTLTTDILCSVRAEAL